MANMLVLIHFVDDIVKWAIIGGCLGLALGAIIDKIEEIKFKIKIYKYYKKQRKNGKRK